MVHPASSVQEQARWLAQQYAPWCLLHMVLKNHPSLVSVALLEELLPPFSLDIDPATPYPSFSSSPYAVPASAPSPSPPSSLFSSSTAVSVPSFFSSHSSSSSSTLALSLSPFLTSQSNYASQDHRQSPPLNSTTVTNTSPKSIKKALLSRYLIQRLHFGYYGISTTISSSAVRYLTARARLQFGYFVIRGRAFWHVTPDDLDQGHQRPISSLSSSSLSAREGRDGKSGARTAGGASGSGDTGRGGSTQESSHRLGRQQQRQHQRRSQDPQQPQHAQQQQQHPQDDDDPGGNKDEDTGAVGTPETTTPHGRRRGGGSGSGSGGAGTDNKHGSTNETEEETDPRLKIAKGNQRCEEREERLLMLEAIRYLGRRQPDLSASLLEELTPTSSSSRGSESCTRHAPSSTPSLTTWLPERRVAAAYWRQIALTSSLDPCLDLTPEDLQRIPASPFLYRRTDALWMTRLQQSTTPTTTSSTTDTSPPVPTWKESKDPTQPRGGMRMVQDDARLFQIASGIFDGLATHPRKLRKPTHSIIDGPLTQSLDILWNLITEYGYMPLPEDDADRKMHYKGGNRAETGDESTSKKRPGQQQQQQQPGSQRLEGEKEGKEEDETEAGLVFPSDGSHVVNNRGLKGQGTSIWYFYDLQRVEVMIAYFVHRAPMVLEWLFERGFEILEAEQEHPIKSKRTLGVSRVSLLQCCIPGCHAMMRHIYRPLEPLKSMPSALAISRVQNELLGFGSKPKRVQFRQEDFLAALRTVAAPCLEESLQVMTELGMEVTVVQDRLVELLEIPGGLAPMDVEKSVLNVLFTQCVHGHIRSAQPESRLGVVDAINAAFQRSFQINMDPSEVLDVAWKHAFEEALVNLHSESCIVHPNVSDWVLETLGPTEPAFMICFDHAILEALVRIMTWNTEQVRRLKKWMKVQEREAKMKMRTGKKWEELKKRLVAPCDHANHSSSSSSSKSDGHENSDLVMLDVTAASSAERVDETIRPQVGLDIEWTTNDTILQTTTTMVASLPHGSEVIRISDDNCLLLDNGCLAQDLLLLCTISGQRCRDRHESHINQDSTETEQTETGAVEMESEEVSTLDVNKRVSKFLERGAVIEEKHWIWLAMGLVTVSLQGRRVTEIPDSAVSGDKGLSMTAEANNDEALSVRMACSPEAYQLIWMTAVAFTRQMWQHIEARVVKSGDDDGNGDRSNSNNDKNEARHHSLPPSGTPPSSWVIHTLQSTLTSTLGDDARLLVEILYELAGEMDALNMKD